MQNNILSPTHPPKFYKNFKTLSATMDQEINKHSSQNKYLQKFNMEQKAKSIHPTLSPAIFSAAASQIVDKDYRKTNNLLLPLFSMAIVIVSVFFAFLLLFRPHPQCSKMELNCSNDASVTAYSPDAFYGTRDGRSTADWRSLSTHLLTLFHEYSDTGQDYLPRDLPKEHDGFTSSADVSNDIGHLYHEKVEPGYLEPADLKGHHECPGYRTENSELGTTLRDLRSLERLLKSYRYQYNDRFRKQSEHDEYTFEEMVKRLNSSLGNILSKPATEHTNTGFCGDRIGDALRAKVTPDLVRRHHH